MIACSRTVNAALRDADGLLRKTLKPKDMRKNATRRRHLVKLKAIQSHAIDDGGRKSEHALNVVAGADLLSQIMQRGTHHPIADARIRRVHPIRGDAAEPLGKRQLGPMLTTYGSIK